MRMTSRETPKLNMDHGFMQSIIRNQVDRDEYEKEQKLLKIQNQGNSVPRKERPKRAAIQMYVPPHLRTKTANDDKDSSTKGNFIFFILRRSSMVIFRSRFGNGGKCKV